MKNLFLPSYLLFLLVMSLSTLSHSSSSKFAGEHMVFAVGYGTSGKLMNNYVLIGDYTFREKSFVAEYKEFDANANLKPKKTNFQLNLETPYGKHACKDKLIDIPSESTEKSVTGAWHIDKKVLKLTINAKTYEWEEDSTNGGYKLRSIRDNILNQNVPLAVGFAYVSKIQNAPIKFKKNDFFPYYRGDIYHKNNHANAQTSWELRSSGLKISVFSESNNNNVLNYSAIGNIGAKGAWVGNSILLNYDMKYGGLIYQDFGHDFNKNGCYDEYGHNKIILVAHNKDDFSTIHNMVYIEYSYTFDGFPMISVGRYYR